MEFIREHQLDIILFLCGVSALLTFTVLIPKSLSHKKKFVLALMSFSSMVLLVFERFSYQFRGDGSTLGYYMVRISNGLVFFLLIFIPFLVTQYLKDFFQNEGKLNFVPISLRLCDLVFLAGTVLLAVSQFTGLYYTFDSQNFYQRSPALFVSYIPPLLMVFLQEYTVIRYRKQLSRGRFLSLALSIILPAIASVIQLFSYGVSLTSMTLIFVVMIYYIYVLIDLNRVAEKAREQEIEIKSFKENQKIKAELFEQTAETLASAIDAKDVYTHGHSARVAVYSRQIAQAAGYSKEECDKVYFTALLHDVGKIGISDSIIKKAGKLTSEEYEQIKLHTTVGDQILANIKQFPTLSVGAHYHHERYDGKGYPDGISGDNIPEIARIIAVADAYDAMASDRSYRSALPPEKIKEELTNGTGFQFDPKFAKIMLQIVENEMKEV